MQLRAAYKKLIFTATVQEFESLGMACLPLFPEKNDGLADICLDSTESLGGGRGMRYAGLSEGLNILHVEMIFPLLG